MLPAQSVTDLEGNNHPEERMNIAETIWQSLLSQASAITLLFAVIYLFRDAILRFINDKISLASKKDLQSREHEFKTQFDEVRRDFERIQSTQEKFLTAFLEVSSERAKAVSKREIEAAEAIWASVETLNRLLLSAKTADMLKFDAIEKHRPSMIRMIGKPHGAAQRGAP